MHTSLSSNCKTEPSTWQNETWNSTSSHTSQITVLAVNTTACVYQCPLNLHPSTITKQQNRNPDSRVCPCFPITLYRLACGNLWSWWISNAAEWTGSLSSWSLPEAISWSSDRKEVWALLNHPYNFMWNTIRKGNFPHFLIFPNFILNVLEWSYCHHIIHNKKATELSWLFCFVLFFFRP